MGEASGRRSIVAFIVALALAGTACGARLTEEQRLAGIGGLAAGGSGPGGIDPTAGPGGLNPTAGPGGSNPTGGPNVLDPSSQPTTLPPGGNGGATDVGVTGTTLRIATIADVRGIQPGLFKSAHQAMQALAAMVNSQGGIDGRQLELLLLDSQISVSATRSAVLEACERAFAIVGSMSAFDNGGAADVDACDKGRGIPDITAITTSKARIEAKSTYPAYPNRPDWFIVGSGQTIKEQHPEVLDNAAQLWLNASTTRINADSKRKTYEHLGFNFTYTVETQAAEANYTPFVQRMKDLNIEYVTMTSDWQSIARLLDAMRKQNWKPTVLEWDSVAYSPKFIQETNPNSSPQGGSAEDSWIYLNTALFEEAAQHPEMQLYQQWLARVAPGAEADYFGLYAWSAGQLFVEAAKRAGPKLTKEKLIAELGKIHTWDGNGLHAPHDIGRNLPSPCTMMVRVKGAAFVRETPASGYNCDKGSLYKVPGY